MLSSEAHFFKALAACWSAQGLTGNYDTARWAIWECYSWTHTRFPGPEVCVCVCVCVCVYVRVSVSCRADHAHRPRTSERTGVSGALGGPLRVDTQDSGTGRTFKSCIFNLKKNKTKQINYHNRAWNFYKWEKTHCQQDLGPANIEEN